MEGLTEGRIVHFVSPSGEHRPAIIVRDWKRVDNPGYVNMLVFADGSNDGEWGKANVVWETSVYYSKEPVVRTWHWIERA